jgi:hypothetical protein
MILITTDHPYLGVGCHNEGGGASAVAWPCWGEQRGLAVPRSGEAFARARRGAAGDERIFTRGAYA